MTALQADVTNDPSSPQYTAVAVVDGQRFAASSLPTLASGSYFLIQVGTEQMAVVGLTLNADTTATLSVVRGANGTAAAPLTAAPPCSWPPTSAGCPRGGAADIGAFEAQGFTLTISSGNNQSAALGSAFRPASRRRGYTAARRGSGQRGSGPVYTPGLGARPARHVLSSSPVTIASASASTTVTADSSPGSYVVTASTAGATAPVTFHLTNSSEAPSLVVTTTADETSSTDGTTSLREAIAFAESLSGTKTITFDPTVFATPQMIVLTLGELALTQTAPPTPRRSSDRPRLSPSAATRPAGSSTSRPTSPRRSPA